jgi:hypothetical protein
MKLKEKKLKKEEDKRLSWWKVKLKIKYKTQNILINSIL